MISVGIIAEIYCAFESSQMAFTYSKVNHGNTSTVKKSIFKEKDKEPKWRFGDVLAFLLLPTYTTENG